MRFLAVTLLLVLAGCGSSPVAPAPVPTPVPFPNMLGGWGGTMSETWTANGGSISGSRVCNETWLITSAGGGVFQGQFQRTPGSLDDCATSGTTSGTISRAGEIAFTQGSTGMTGSCTVPTGTDLTVRGVLSAAGNITAGVIVPLVRCPAGRGTIDYRFTHAVTLTRR